MPPNGAYFDQQGDADSPPLLTGDYLSSVTTVWRATVELDPRGRCIAPQLHVRSYHHSGR